MPNIHFIKENIIAEVPEGMTILEAAIRSKVLIESPCNAMGTCGKCKVRIPLSELKNVRQREGNHKLSEEELEKGLVLSCLTEVYGDLQVETLNLNQELKIISEGNSFSYEIKNNILKSFNGQKTSVFENNIFLGEEQGDTTAHNYGLSIDIGTTTLVAELIDLNHGEPICSVSMLNPQSLTAQDVLSRIQFASNDHGLEKMYHDIRNQINSMILELEKKAKINRKFIYEVIYSGNTTMIHLAMNINPEPLGKYPYRPVISGGQDYSARQYGIEISSFGKIYIPPAISAYVGPDITSGVLASQLDKAKGITLFIDIGTNGEMIIANNGLLSATSTAAGPAFEGMNISCGMRAGEGAIESFEIDENHNIHIKTIGNKEAIGICGSGIFDIVGELVRVGVIEQSGRLVSPEKKEFPKEIASRLIRKDGKVCFAVAENIFFTQKDIRQVQLAKGAIRSGVEALLESQAIKAEEVDYVQIAGSFGFHLREASLFHMGILPNALKNKVSFVGNTSKSGATAFLLHFDFREEMKETVKEIHVVELGTKEDYDKLFVKCLSFPEV